MKKNKFLKIASGLLMLVLITCCAVSGTFAKYTTSGTATDTARVAKWGIELTVSAHDNMFKTNYNDSVVNLAGTTKLVAPGTDGSLGGFSIKGTPEVDFQLDVAVNLELVNWEQTIDSVDTYCPLVFKVGGTTLKIDSTITDAAKLEEAVENAIKEAIFGSVVDSKTYEANDTTFATANTLEITWEWAFNDADDAISKNDTLLGNAAANGTAPSITFTLTITASQLD